MDYAAISEQLQFDGSGGMECVPVSIIDDNAVEGTESFSISVSTETFPFFSDSVAVTILDDLGGI